MKLKCDACGIEYEGEKDMHERDEPNICCPHCEWLYKPIPITNPKAEPFPIPQPKHTCKPAKIRVMLH